MRRETRAIASSLLREKERERTLTQSSDATSWW